MSPILLVGAGILLFGLGLGLGYALAHRLKKREASKASEIQNELDDYRRQVSEHFSETADHFQALGQQYQSLYKHMAKGADALCDPARTGGRLEFPAAATAALTAGELEAEAVPQSIKDYAPEEPDEAVESEVTAAEAETAQAPAEASAAEETVPEDAPKEEIGDSTSKPTPEETERTVH